MSTTFKIVRDGTPETYEMVEGFTFAEARAFEKVTGIPVGRLQEEGVKQSTDALQAMLWIAIKRREPTTKFSDLDNIEIGSINFVSDEDDESPLDLAGDDTNSSPSAA